MTQIISHNKNILHVIILFCFLNSFGQNFDLFFDQYTNQSIVNIEGKSPYVYELFSEKITSRTTNKPTKRLTSFYKKAIAFKNKAQSDSIKIAEFKKDSKPLSNLNEAEVNSRLKTARRTLKNVKKYEITLGDTIVKTFYKLKIRRSVFKPENVIIGDFKTLGFYYVIKNVEGFTESSLISVEEAKEKHLTKDQFLFENEFVVIENTHTKICYMVFPEFIEKFPVKKITDKIKT